MANHIIINNTPIIVDQYLKSDGEVKLNIDARERFSKLEGSILGYKHITSNDINPDNNNGYTVDTYNKWEKNYFYTFENDSDILYLATDNFTETLKNDTNGIIKIYSYKTSIIDITLDNDVIGVYNRLGQPADSISDAYTGIFRIIGKNGNFSFDRIVYQNSNTVLYTSTKELLQYYFENKNIYYRTLKTVNEALEVEWEVLCLQPSDSIIQNVRGSSVPFSAYGAYNLNKTIYDKIEETEVKLNNSLTEMAQIVNNAEKISNKKSQIPEDNANDESLYPNMELIRNLETSIKNEIVGKRNDFYGEVFNDYIDNEANGGYSHAEGHFTRTDGYCSHAEGYVTEAKGDSSHAEGLSTRALSDFSHSEGLETEVQSKSSHVEGYNNQVGIKGYPVIGSTKGEKNYWELTIPNIDFNVFGFSYNIDTNIKNAYLENDIIQLDLNYHYYNRFKIVSIEQDEYTTLLIITTINDEIIEDYDLSLKDAIPDDFSWLSENKNYIWVTGKSYGTDIPLHNGTHGEGSSNIAIGLGAHAEGANTQALGNYSHTEGKSTKAHYSAHAEGASTEALGEYSHAEGGWTTAEGNFGHSEGTETQALGYVSHAEGRKNVASGSISHAEGDDTKAKGRCSHAEGLESQANGEVSHAEGWGTVANGNYSHAEGWESKTQGTASHAEGWSRATADYSHSEGYNTQASGVSSHAEGNNTIARGNSQHVEGKFNIEDNENKYAHIVGNGSSGNRSNAHTVDWQGNAWYSGGLELENGNLKIKGSSLDIDNGKLLINGSPIEGSGGGSTSSINLIDGTGKNSLLQVSAAEASGEASFAEGSVTFARGFASHAEGEETDAIGFASHTEGSFSEARGSYSHAEGIATYVSGQGAHVEGLGTTATVDYSHVQGKWNIIDSEKKYAHIVGNGEDSESLSNAHTLDWEGNAWYAKSVEAPTIYTNQVILLSSGNKKFALKVRDDGTLYTEEVSN